MAKPTILMALMGLDIGGAETHAVILCRHLKDMGYNIIVASNGGIFEKELESYGIKHYKVGLNTKRPIKVIQSIFELVRIIKAEKVDLIHAHARIPAFICNIISRLYAVKFITTAHAKFKDTLLLKILSVWGEKTIAVSEDIRQHLISAFRVPEKNIEIITNGMDTEKFKPGIDYASISQELSIDDSYKKIVWVSRVDEQLFKTINELIESADILKQKLDKFVITIVGGGVKEEEVWEKVKEKNRQLGCEAIKFLGRRTDIDKILSFGDIFVGISRAAMEAMAMQKPVILAGPWSFMGLFDKSKAADYIKDNFTGRSFSEPVTKENLAIEIIKTFEMTDNEKNDITEFERKIIMNYFSSYNMAEKTAEVYDKILNKGEK